MFEIGEANQVPRGERDVLRVSGLLYCICLLRKNCTRHVVEDGGLATDEEGNDGLGG